jgi:Na+/H+-dicarboxylate symporter/ABC-type amino acid transport substrate-binding protein
MEHRASDVPLRMAHVLRSVDVQTTGERRGTAVRMTFFQQILVGLGAGILTGLFFGERAAALKWAADGFVKLLQMMVLPYITVSIIASLGTLDLREARTLGWRVAAIIASLWLIALCFAFLIPLTFPTVQNASFFSTSLVERRPPFDFIDLYIPANPFYSLANNIVPAVVLFSIVLGVALIQIERKERLIEVLAVIRDAISSATRFVTRLTPYGLFAISATAAGTLSVDQVSRLQVFLIAYVVVALWVSLWVLPGLVAALTPIRARDVLRESREGLITAAVAGDLFIVLPLLTHASSALLGRLKDEEQNPSRLPEVVVPASFNFPHTGKLLSLSFVLFAGWFADAWIPRTKYPELALAGLVSFFGSLNSAVPFLLDLFRIPADTFQLFIATGVINSRVGSLVAASHTMAVALLASCAMTGHLVWRRGRLVPYVVITVLLTTGLIGATRVMLARRLSLEYSKDRVLASMHLLNAPVDAAVYRTPVPAEGTNGSILEAVAARGALRVGYMNDALPFAFFNERGDLVGFDVEVAHRLASDMRVGLTFVPVDRANMFDQLRQGYCDLIMSGVVLTPLRARDVLFSESYLDETLALVVPDYERGAFDSWDTIRARGAITIAAPNIPYYLGKLHELLPDAVLKPNGDIDDLFRHGDNVDAIAMPAERGSAWTLMYPRYSVVVPGPSAIRVPLAYPIARQDVRFMNFINAWIALKRKDGTFDAAFNYWILGRDAGPRRPRWCIARDVLHWME